MTVPVILDIECYKNYFLLALMCQDRVKTFEIYENNILDKNNIHEILNNYLTIGFNSISYDLPMLCLALKEGTNNSLLKEFSDELIQRTKEKSVWDIIRKRNVYTPRTWNHIDLISIPKGVAFHSLKTYGARLHTKKLQDLPYSPDSFITEEMRQELVKYCINDLHITKDLYHHLKEDISLRANISNIYNIDLRSKSKAQIAEKIIRKEIDHYNVSFPELKETEEMYYKAPSYLNFKTEYLQNLKNNIENINIKLTRGKIDVSSPIFTKLKIGDGTYKMGIGGLHSEESNRCVIPKDHEFLIDVDVVSYYPSMIINNNYSPRHLGDKFISLFKTFYEERLIAKKNKDLVKSETYKIILNGSFGKFGSQYSILYDPFVLLKTTITGQLNLLMLIEAFECAGFKVCSSNTDGVTVLGEKENSGKINDIIKTWEQTTNLQTEKVEYKALYSESVNSYIAIKTDGQVKLKGNYAENSLNKNPVIGVCKKAVIKYLTENKPVENTILEEKDIKEFITIRSVTGGGEYKGQYLGKIVRWYYSLDGDYIAYKKNGNKVASSDDCKPLMDLPDKIPEDIDYSIYLTKTKKMLKELGVFDERERD